ncbi:hypothetical protein [Kibdelosporangium phytohabitans]|nr:hypothetical protein [Kibdelosporangium phytohabitans]MBE1471555.1 hypothetical protein [Kibdelosporangium phytohabitans]
MATSRARAVAAQLADAMTATPMRRRDDALRVGAPRLQSGRTGDPRILLEAANQAKDWFGHALANGSPGRRTTRARAGRPSNCWPKSCWTTAGTRN